MIKNKSPLTKRERRKAYEWALRNYKKQYRGPYLCNVLAEYCDEIYCGDAVIHCFNVDFIESTFPELFSFKPKYKVGAWWSDESRMREKVLRKSIALTSPIKTKSNERKKCLSKNR